jgi:hypothetical protein
VVVSPFLFSTFSTGRGFDAVLVLQSPAGVKP